MYLFVCVCVCVCFFFFFVAVQGAPGDLHIASISDMIRGAVSSTPGEGGDGAKRRGFEATFEVTTTHVPGSMDSNSETAEGPRKALERTP